MKDVLHDAPRRHRDDQCHRAELPVADWNVDGLRVWPLVRYQLGAEMASHWRLPAGQPPGSAGLDRGKARALRLLREYAGWTRARIADRRNHQSLGRPYDAVFLQIFPRPVRLNGHWMCPFAEPLRWHLAAHDLDMLVLDLCGGVRGYPIPRHAPSRHVSFEDRLAIRIRNRRYPHSKDVQLPGISRLSTFLAAWPEVPVPGEAAVLDVVRTVRVWSDYFARIIARTQPRIGFVPSYFGPAAFAFVLACHKAGIPSVNLQHGYQGIEHVAFASWTAVPRGGYELLPSYFWCWSRADVAAIESWSSQLGTHVAIHGGNPWINMWERLRDHSDPAVRLDDVGTEPGRVDVLYTFLRATLPARFSCHSHFAGVMGGGCAAFAWRGAGKRFAHSLADSGPRVEIERATDALAVRAAAFRGRARDSCGGGPGGGAACLGDHHRRRTLRLPPPPDGGHGHGADTIGPQSNAYRTAAHSRARPLHLSEDAEAAVVRAVGPCGLALPAARPGRHEDRGHHAGANGPTRLPGKVPGPGRPAMLARAISLRARAGPMR